MPEGSLCVLSWASPYTQPSHWKVRQWTPQFCSIWMYSHWDAHGPRGYSLGFITLSIIWSTHREIPRPRPLVVVQLMSPGGPVAVFFLQAFAPTWRDLAQPAHHPLHRPDATRYPALLRRAASLACLRALFMAIYADPPAGAYCSTTRWPLVLLACLSYMVLGAVIVFLIWRHGYPAYLPAVLVFTVVNILLYGFNLVRMGALLSGEARGADGSARGQTCCPSSPC